MPLTSAERLRRCYFHEELDRPGIYFRTGFPADDPTYDRVKRLIRETTDLKVGWSGITATPTPVVRYEREPVSADFERVWAILETPAGELRSSRLASLKGQPGMTETHYIKSRDDAEKYLSLPPPQIRVSADTFAAALTQAGERGIVEVGLGMNPAGTVADLCGSETFALMTLTDRDVLHALCRQRLAVMLDTVKALAAARIGPYFAFLGQEYLVPPLHGAADFNDFNVRYDRQITAAIHDAGGRVHIHSHGRIRTVMPGFIEMGADVLHPFEAPPMGDITAAEAKRLARGRLCLEGNIQIGDVYDRTAEQIRAQTDALIRDAFDDRRGLIVCPTASLYIRGRGEACLPACQAMIDAVLNWRHG